MALHLFDDFALRPTQLLDQHFGLGMHPDELFAPLTFPSRHHPHHPHHNTMLRTPSYYRPWRLPSRDVGSVVTCDKDKFQINLDVQHFTPEEISVKIIDNNIIIEGNHEEKLDEHGFVSRQFKRRYLVPKDHNAEQIVSKLSSDGVLTIAIPKLEAIESNERKVPITHTGEPHKAIKPEEKKEEKKK